MESSAPKMSAKCLYGVGGKIVDLLMPYTEADPAAIYMQLLAYFGNVIGRSAYFKAESSFHYTNLFVLVVGVSSRGRKGSSLKQVRSLFDSEFFGDHKEFSIATGLSSGEGLIYKLQNSQDSITPLGSGVFVKRLLCEETEFGSVLKNIARQGNTLSVFLRQAWDGEAMETLTKNSPLRVEGAHVSVIGHITQAELMHEIDPVEIKNGFGNRFLYICASRSKSLPDGSKVPEREMVTLKDFIVKSFHFATAQEEVPFDVSAREYWTAIYDLIGSSEFGIVSDLTGRAHAQIRRIATVLAVLNCESVVTYECLLAAHEIFQYSEHSLRHIFGNSVGNKKIDRIISALDDAAEFGLTTTELSKVLGNNEPVRNTLKSLINLRRIVSSKEKIAGIKKPTDRYFLVEHLKPADNI